MAVLGGLEVDWAGQVELLDDHSWAEVKVGADDLLKLVRGVVGGSVGVNVNGSWLSDTDGVGELDETTASELGVDEGLGDPAGNVGSGTIDLGEVLSGESTTSVGSPSTVGVDNDLASGKTGITLWSTNDEQTRWLDLLKGLDHVWWLM